MKIKMHTVIYVLATNKKLAKQNAKVFLVGSSVASEYLHTKINERGVIYLQHIEPQEVG